MKDINFYKIPHSLSIREAIKVIDEGGIGFCVCVDDKEKAIGVISDGDFRRAVHSGIQLDENVVKITNKEFFYVEKDHNKKDLEKIFNNPLVRQVPVLEEGKLLDIITRENFCGDEISRKRKCMDSQVVIMAGGKGTRLDPFTRILPKALAPLGNDPVIKVIMDEFKKFGMNDFFISLHDKGSMIKAYFHDHSLGYRIDYIDEAKPLGSAGALKKLEGKVNTAFFVSNCDIMIHADYSALFDFHKKGSYDLTLVGSMQHYAVPYAVCDIENGGILKKIREKPQSDLLVNTGLYILEPAVLRYIPLDTNFSMIDLIRKAQDDGSKVGVFPVSEKSWIDVGQLSEYTNIISKLT